MPPWFDFEPAFKWFRGVLNEAIILMGVSLQCAQTNSVYLPGLGIFKECN